MDNCLPGWNRNYTSMSSAMWSLQHGLLENVTESPTSFPLRMVTWLAWANRMLTNMKNTQTFYCVCVIWMVLLLWFEPPWEKPNPDSQRPLSIKRDTNCADQIRWTRAHPWIWEHEREYFCYKPLFVMQQKLIHDSPHFPYCTFFKSFPKWAVSCPYNNSHSIRSN